MRGVTANVLESERQLKISTHTPHARRDSWEMPEHSMKTKFLLTRLMRGVTPRPLQSVFLPIFLLTRLMRGVTRHR